MDKASRIFVAGHRGLVGSAILRKLQAEGYTNLVTRTRAELDLRDQAAVNRFFEEERPEYVFLAAAKVGGILANSTYPADFIRDNLQIEVTEYRILIAGRVVGNGRLQPNEFLAIDPGGTHQEIDGAETIDPAFGLPAKWVSESMRRRAEMAGYTVVDAPTVLITHLGECLKKHAHELLSREDLQKMLEKLKEHSPTIVNELKPDVLRPGILHQLLIQLLKESISIAALERIIESAIHHGPQTPNVSDLVEKVRADIGPIIVDPFRDDSGRVRVIVLEPKLEHYFRENMQADSIALQPSQLEHLVDTYQQAWEVASLKNAPAAALVDSSIRRAMRQTLNRSLPKLSFIAYTEIPSDLLIEPISMIRYDQIMDATNSPSHVTAGLPAHDETRPS